MVINLIFDKPDICAHEGFGHSVSLDHSLCNTHSHTYRYFLSLSLSLSLLPSPDTVVKDLFDLWPRPTWHRYWFFLRPSQSGMKKGENGGISRHSQVAEGTLRMKESDQCVLMAELALAETTVSHGENQEGLRQDVWATLMRVWERMEEVGGKGGEVLLCFRCLRICQNHKARWYVRNRSIPTRYKIRIRMLY